MFINILFLWLYASDCNEDRITPKHGINFLPYQRNVEKSVGVNGQKLLNGHMDRVDIIKPNPKYDMLATSCINLALWVK